MSNYSIENIVDFFELNITLANNNGLIELLSQKATNNIEFWRMESLYRFISGSELSIHEYDDDYIIFKTDIGRIMLSFDGNLLKFEKWNFIENIECGVVGDYEKELNREIYKWQQGSELPINSDDNISLDKYNKRAKGLVSMFFYTKKQDNNLYEGSLVTEYNFEKPENMIIILIYFKLFLIDMYNIFFETRVGDLIFGREKIN